MDEKSNFELLQLLNDVVSELDAKHRVDLRQETDEYRTFRFVECFKLLKFHFPTDVDSFREGLSAGHRHIVYPVLSWLLSSFEQHVKRAYLGKYLAPVQIPTEFLHQGWFGITHSGYGYIYIMAILHHL